MKQILLMTSCFSMVVAFTACNSDTQGNTPMGDTATKMGSDTNSATNGGGIGNGQPNGTTGANPNTTGTQTDATSTAAKAPFTKDDSVFVMKAAAGGMLEVQAGNTAQQNAASDRVKAFGAMMITDHTQANNELMGIASAHGVTPPADLPADLKKHVTMMQGMKGKAFDSHYIGMMLTDHKKDVALFEKEAASGADADLKAFAAKTLPTLKAHLDSAQAISKAKK